MSKTPEQALAAYDALYKSPRTGEYIIDTDEAQVAADLAEALRAALPTYAVYAVYDVTPFRGKRVKNIVQAGFASVTDAQNYIARIDPSGRRDFDVQEAR